MALSADNKSGVIYTEPPRSKVLRIFFHGARFEPDSRKSVGIPIVYRLEP